MKLKMLVNLPVSRNGLTAEDFKKGQVYDVGELLFKSLTSDPKIAVEYLENFEVAKTVKVDQEIKEKKKPGRPKANKNIKESPINKAFNFTPKDK
jgi:hypothetical protein